MKTTILARFFTPLRFAACWLLFLFLVLMVCGCGTEQPEPPRIFCTPDGSCFPLVVGPAYIPGEPSVDLARIPKLVRL